MRHIYQTASAVQHLHENGIAHRDIKLENIMLDDNLDVQLIDFGFCFNSNDEKEHYLENLVIGSYSYLAPELLLTIYQTNNYYTESETSESISDKLEKYKSGDVFALGVTLFTMVIGMPPFSYASKEDSNYRAFLLSIKRPETYKFWTTHPKAKELYVKGELSSDFISLIMSMLHPDSQKRPCINTVLSHSWLQKYSCALLEEQSKLEASYDV